jgi:hypothetical protein
MDFLRCTVGVDLGAEVVVGYVVVIDVGTYVVGCTVGVDVGKESCRLLRSCAPDSGLHRTPPPTTRKASEGDGSTREGTPTA